MSDPGYAPVLPRDHDATCRRGNDSASDHYGLDRATCQRCRALWARLVGCAFRRQQGANRP